MTQEIEHWKEEDGISLNVIIYNKVGEGLSQTFTQAVKAMDKTWWVSCKCSKREASYERRAL